MRVVERSDELGELLFGDPAQLADLEAAQLAGPEQVIDLVPSDVQHLRCLLDGVSLQLLLTSFALAEGASYQSTRRWARRPAGILRGRRCSRSRERACAGIRRAIAGPGRQ